MNNTTFEITEKHYAEAKKIMEFLIAEKGTNSNRPLFDDLVPLVLCCVVQTELPYKDNSENAEQKTKDILYSLMDAIIKYQFEIQRELKNDYK